MDIQPAFGLSYHQFDPKIKKCGCYVRHPDLLENVKPKTHVAIPLKHIDYDIEVTNGLVSTTLQQKYFNPTQKYLEIDFSFPIDPKACIYKFVAEFGNKRIEGIVKEKEQAKAEYKEAVQQGKQAVYAEIDQNSKDIMNMEIGNLGPNEELKVSISYLQQLNVEQNTFYQLHIPSTISPRYMNDINGRRWTENVQSVQGEYTWTFKITFLTSKKLAYYVSHSHNLQLISENAEKTETILCLAKEEKPNVDLSLLFTVEDFHLPSYVLGRTDVSCTAMLSFIPKFCELSLDDAMKASMVKKQLETDMSAAKGEYIFLLDRSGSMGGKRIEKAKEALILFLQSLPEDTYFNVVSFGDGSNFMFNQSIKYQKDSLEDAVKKIGTMRADMGGTEIYNPLSKILQTKVIDGYPKQIFLLTDGGVSNTEGVIQLVGREVKYSRCHSIGIGNGCSEALIKGCSEKGKGKFIFITDQENPSEKIIGLLEETLTPVIDHVTLKYDKDLVKSIVPNPESLPYILKNEVVNFYITFKGQLEKSTEFTFGYKDSMNKLPFETKMEIDPESQNMPFVDKMAHNKIIKNLEVSAKENKPIEEFMFYVKVADKKKEAIEHSVKHQILSEYTAFICVNQQLIDGKYQQIRDIGSEKIQIQPSIRQDLNKRQLCQSLPLYAQHPPIMQLYSPKIPSPNNLPISSNVPQSIPIQPMYAPDMKINSASSDWQQPNQNVQQSYKAKSKSSTFGSLFGAIGKLFSGNKASPKVPTQHFLSNQSKILIQPPKSSIKQQTFMQDGFSNQQQQERKFMQQMMRKQKQRRLRQEILRQQHERMSHACQQKSYKRQGSNQDQHKRKLRQEQMRKQYERQMRDQHERICKEENERKIRQEVQLKYQHERKLRQEQLLKTYEEMFNKEYNQSQQIQQSFIPVCIPKTTPEYSQIHKNSGISIQEVIRQMNVDGSFPSQDILKSLFPDIYDKIIEESLAKNIPITVVVSYLVAKWIEIYHPQKQYVLIAKKAMSFVKKQIELDKVQFLDEILR